MENKCIKEGCNPLEGGCTEGKVHFQSNEESKRCKYWDSKLEELAKKIEEPFIEKDNCLTIGWNGNSFGTDSIHLIGKRNAPIVIGVIGLVESGKTTFLAMIYLLLAKGNKFEDYSFNGSYTLNGWEIISHTLRWNKNELFSFPARTTSEMSREKGFLHFALREKKTNEVRDVVFTDVPGEWFSNWTTESSAPNAEGGKYVIENSDGFLFLLDCEGLRGSKRGKIRGEVELLAKKISDHIESKPIAFLWSKSDKKKEIPSKVVEKLIKKLDTFFNQPITFDVSYQKGKDMIYHKNILQSVDWLLEKMLDVSKKKLVLEKKIYGDYFFKIKNI